MTAEALEAVGGQDPEVPGSPDWKSVALEELAHIPGALLPRWEADEVAVPRDTQVAAQAPPTEMEVDPGRVTDATLGEKVVADLGRAASAPPVHPEVAVEVGNAGVAAPVEVEGGGAALEADVTKFRVPEGSSFEASRAVVEAESAPARGVGARVERCPVPASLAMALVPAEASGGDSGLEGSGVQDWGLLALPVDLAAAARSEEEAWESQAVWGRHLQEQLQEVLQRHEVNSIACSSF